MKELWVQYKNTPYMVSSMGRVVAIYKKFWKFKKMNTDQDGYFKTSITEDGKHKTPFVHRLVATCFIDNPKNLPVINHIDGIKKNNCVDNLEWTTVQKNTQHAYDHCGFRGPIGEINHFSRLKTHQVIEIKKDILNGIKASEIAAKFDISIGHVGDIRRGKKWAHVCV